MSSQTDPDPKTVALDQAAEVIAQILLSVAPTEKKQAARVWPMSLEEVQALMLVIKVAFNRSPLLADAVDLQLKRIQRGEEE